MRIAVVGSGALGIYYGALLQRAGNDVSFLMRRDYDAAVKYGITVRSINGDFRLDRVSAALHPEEIGVVDLVLVGLKTFANGSFSGLISPLVGDSTAILTLQNGLGNEEALSEIFGAERILGGVAFLCANRGEPGVVHHLGAGRIELGAFAGAPDKLLSDVTELFVKAGVDCRKVDDLKSARWQKLVWNIPFNGLCALLDSPVDAILGNVSTRKLVREIMIEVIDAANLQGVKQPVPHDFADRMIQFSDGMGPYQPSMQIDRHEGRPLELEAIFANAINAGLIKGVALPRTSMLLALLEYVEVG